MSEISYWDLRKRVSQIVPRMTKLELRNKKAVIVREKGRKKNYSQFDLKDREWQKQERLLNTEEINSFLEISCRAAACPMPFNMDVYDSLTCIAEDQLVRTKRGNIPIQDVESGDLVLSFNETTKTLEWKPVKKITTSKRSDMIELKTESGKTLLLTADHPVYTTNRGWVLAKQLTESDELLES